MFVFMADNSDSSYQLPKTIRQKLLCGRNSKSEVGSMHHVMARGVAKTTHTRLHFSRIPMFWKNRESVWSLHMLNTSSTSPSKVKCKKPMQCPAEWILYYFSYTGVPTLGLPQPHNVGNPLIKHIIKSLTYLTAILFYLNTTPSIFSFTGLTITTITTKSGEMQIHDLSKPRDTQQA